MGTLDGSPPPGLHRTQRWAMSTIRWYQQMMHGRLSPCRFTPSCSSYALEAFELHGSRRGGFLTLRRLLRCRPFGPSGYDPVPDRSIAPHDDACVTAHASPTDSKRIVEHV